MFAFLAFFFLALLTFGAPESHASVASKMARTPAVKRILDTYGFPADPSVNEASEFPRGWVDPSKQPARALLLGRPSRVPHKNLAVEVGLFLPGKLAILEGTHEAIALHNAALSLWIKGGEAAAREAESLLEEAQEKIRALPASSVERASVQLLRGHMAFARYVDLVRGDSHTSDKGTPEKRAREKSEPEKSEPVKSEPEKSKNQGDEVRTARNRMLSAYGDALERRDVVGLFASPDAAVDGTQLRAGLTVGFFPARPHLKSGALTAQVTAQSGGSAEANLETLGRRPLLSEYPMDPLRNLRSQAIPALWNLAILQATVNNWQSAFEVANALDSVFERLGNRAPLFHGEAANPLVEAYDVNTVANAVWLLPRHRADMSASLSLLRAGALGLAGDPIGVLEEADKAIRRADSLLLSAVGFHLASDVYLGLGNDALAARTFEWAFAMDARYPARVPSVVFFSAENAFWRGDRKRALAGFKTFLETFGDPVYGPWARLRLASLAHASEDLGSAELEYNRIRRLTPAHPASLDALVRLFCLENADAIPGAADVVRKGFSNVRGTKGTRVRAQALADVLAAVSNAAPHLKEQASACALGSKMALTAEETAGARTREAVAARADALLAHVDTFEKDHAESDFSVLHAARKKNLALGREGQKVLAKNDCIAALGFYAKHGERLFSSNAADTLGEFRWRTNERQFLSRCAFLVKQGDIRASDKNANEAAVKTAEDVNRRALAGAWEPSTLELQSALAAFVAAPGPKTEQALLQKVGRKDLLAAAEKKEKAGLFLVSQPDFWRLVAASRLLSASLARSGPQRSTQNSLALRAQRGPQENAFLERVLADPSLVAKDDRSCLAVVSAFERLPRSRMEGVFKSQDVKTWLENLEPDDTQAASKKPQAAGCLKLLANRFLLEAREGRSKILEKSLLLPWLQAKGVARATDEWLEHAWRLERRKGSQDPEVRALFKQLSKEADNESVKETARGWLEKNASSGDAVW
jgi:hypothetical protein